MSDVVTGEAVALELQLAKLPSRALAFGIDLAVMLIAFLVIVGVATGLVQAVDDALGAALALVLTLTVFVGYPVTLETLTRGRSLGKIAMGLRVVRQDGGPIRFRHALTRGLAGFIIDFGVFSLFTGAVALVASLASAQGQRVGDMLAGTVVLRERAPARQLPPVGMPAPLAGWAAGLELSRLPDRLALDARQYLLRAAQLDPQVRASMGAALATEVAGHVDPPPPPGTPAEPYLAAVLAERRRRDGVRLAARQPAPAEQPSAPGSVTPPLPGSGPAAAADRFAPPG